MNFNQHRPDGCKGYLKGALQISPQTAETAENFNLGCPIFGSYATLFWLWRHSLHSFPSIMVLLAITLELLDLNRVAVAQEAQDLQFTALGVVDSQYYSDGTLTDHLTNEFACYVSKGKYSMFLTASNPKDKQTRSFECLFDGTNTYFTRRLSTNPVRTVLTMKQGQLFEHQLSKPLPANNNAILEITKGSMPSTVNQAVVVVWLGLGSIADPGEALATSQAPLTYLGKVYRDQHIKLKAASKTHESIPNFLEWREDYHEGNILSENHGTLQRIPLAGSLSLGYTNSIYNVVAWTNVMGLSFPEQAQLKIFLPSKDKTSVECRIVCSAMITSIQLGSPDSLYSPVVVAKTTVNDRRQKGDSAKAAPYYLSLDGGLLSPSQLTSNPRYKVSPHQLDNVKTTPISKRHVFLFIIGLLFLAPPMLLLFFRWKQPVKETKKTNKNITNKHM